MTVDPRSFRKALGCFASGVTVVTTVNPDDQKPIGVTVSAFSSLSLDPPLVLFCLGNQTSTLEAYRRSGRFVINVLAEGQRDLSIRFASRTEDKWAGVGFQSGAGDVPVLGGCIANLECATVDMIDGGDHVIFIGRVETIHYQEGGAPLMYFRGAYMDMATSL